MGSCSSDERTILLVVPAMFPGVPDPSSMEHGMTVSKTTTNTLNVSLPKTFMFQGCSNTSSKSGGNSSKKMIPNKLSGNTSNKLIDKGGL